MITTPESCIYYTAMIRGLVGCGEGVVLKEKEEEFCIDSKEDEVVLRVEDVSLVDGVLKGAFGGDIDDDFAMVEGRKKHEWQPQMKKRKKMTEKNEEGGDYLIKRYWSRVRRCRRSFYVEFLV
nr:hypothetical protein [Tanacetum cinerariifolium]